MTCYEIVPNKPSPDLPIEKGHVAVEDTAFSCHPIFLVSDYHEAANDVLRE